MTPKELEQRIKSIQFKRQLGKATKEDEIEWENIQEAVDREAKRFMPEVVIGGGEENDAIKRACKKLGLPEEFWVFFQK